jgi:hypothetical protein
MKNLRFVSGSFFGLLLAICLLIMIKCKSDRIDQVTKVTNSFSLVKDISNGTGGNVYKLTIDNIQYIVVEKDGGVGIIKHQ